MVDSGEMPEVLTHHQHVLHAAARLPWYQETSRMTAEHFSSESASADPEIADATEIREPNERSAETRLRRYGHGEAPDRARSFS